MLKQFKIRASAIGKIMSGTVGASESQLKFMQEMDERDKPMTKIQSEKYGKALFAKNNPQLPEGAKTYCQEWLKQELYGQRIEYSNKYTKKGWDVEDESIKYLNPEYDKNVISFENDFMTGTPDILLDDMIRDVKNSWDYTTFPLFEDKLPNKDYWWQGQGYMELAGKDNYSVDYMLMDTPDDDSLSYNHLGRPLRVKSFPFERDRNCMKEVQERVQLCRDYINTLVDADMLGAMSDKPDMTCFGEEVEI